MGEPSSVLVVKLFAVLRDRFGTESVSVALPAPATAGELLARIAAEHPDHARQLSVCRVAVNHRFALAGDAVSAGDEVALIPPVSGG